MGVRSTNVGLRLYLAVPLQVRSGLAGACAFAAEENEEKKAVVAARERKKKGSLGARRYKMPHRAMAVAFLIGSNGIRLKAIAPTRTARVWKRRTATRGRALPRA